MRVLLVTHYFADHRSGSEIVAGEIAKRLADQGVVIVWVASGPAPEHSHDGISLVPMTTWNVIEELLGVPYPLWGPRSLLRLVRETRLADVVHLHDCLYVGNVIAALGAGVRGKPVLVTQHIGTVPYSSRVLRGLMSLANRTIGRLVLGHARQCVFCSEKVQRYFEGVVRFKREPVLVPNGVSKELFHPLSAERRQKLRDDLGWSREPVVLFVGRFVEKKGLHLIRGLAERIDGCRFILIGWGPEKPQNWRLPHVHCFGPLRHEDTARYYQAADLLLLPSVGEGFPLVVQEAMACGTPVLISDDTADGFGAIRDVAFVCGLDLNLLEARLRGLLGSPALLLERRPLVAEFARVHWDWPRSAQRYAAFLAGLSSSVEPTGVA